MLCFEPDPSKARVLYNAKVSRRFISLFSDTYVCVLCPKLQYLKSLVKSYLIEYVCGSNFLGIPFISPEAVAPSTQFVYLAWWLKVHRVITGRITVF